jgi:hypothetical protein
MSWSYDENLSTNKDKVRSLVQDTDSSVPLISDEEITLQLTLFTSQLFLAAAACCDLISLQLAKQESLETDLVFDVQKASERYAAMADKYRALATSSAASAGTLPVPYAGGVSYADKDSNRQDTDRVRPSFSTGFGVELSESERRNADRGD